MEDYVTAEEETFFYLLDQAGTTVGITDESGALVWRADASPFVTQEGKTGPAEESLKYTGKDRDPATGLYYFNARWYDASTGRFTTKDPIRDAWNWYQFAWANPLRYVDPSGLIATEDWLTAYDDSDILNPDNVDVPPQSSSADRHLDSIESNPPIDRWDYEYRSETPGYAQSRDKDGDGDIDETLKRARGRVEAVANDRDLYVSAEVVAASMESSIGTGDNTILSVTAISAEASVGLMDGGVEAQASASLVEWSGVQNVTLGRFKAHFGLSALIGGVGAGVDVGITDSTFDVEIGAAIGVGGSFRFGFGHVDVEE